MKKYILTILLFIGVVTIIDISFGYICDYLHKNAKGGGIEKRLYLAEKSNEQILMFGSSRMCHHYNPAIIEDSLKMTCFNAGQDGNGIIMAYGFLRMVLERYTPNMIIYDLSPFDYIEDDNIKYINYLKPYYKNVHVKQIIHDVSPVDKYKMISSFYQYNSQITSLIKCYVSPLSFTNGYLPLDGTMNYDYSPQINETSPSDNMKLKYLKMFIKTCKENNIPLVFCLSPQYKVSNSNEYNTVKDIILQEQIPLLDFYSYPRLANNKDYFKDRTHLNSAGADAFTKELIPHLRGLLRK